MTLCPNFETLATRGNLDVRVAETLDDSLRPGLEVTIRVEAVIEIDSNEWIVVREDKA